jgi:hypothetical protein
MKVLFRRNQSVVSVEVVLDTYFARNEKDRDLVLVGRKEKQHPS